MSGRPSAAQLALRFGLTFGLPYSLQLSAVFDRKPVEAPTNCSNSAGARYEVP
ncbi:hypothetical protein D3C86_1179620 [compost metagenome]